MAFSFSSAINNLVNGLTNNASDVVTCLNDLKTYINGANLDNTQLSSAAGIKMTQLGGGAGKTNITSTETRNNVAYGTLTTPDQVTGIVHPTDGLLVIEYQATWQESVAGAGRAAIFIGATQLKVATPNDATPVTTAALTNTATAATDYPLFSCSHGLASAIKNGGSSPTAYAGDVTTGQIVGGVMRDVVGAGIGCELGATTLISTGQTLAPAPIKVFAAAGTYTVSVQYKASAGTVTAKNRKLWVSSEAYA